MIVEVVGLAEDIAEVVVVEIELVVQAGPVDVFQLGRDQAEHYDHHNQNNSLRRQFLKARVPSRCAR